MKNTTIITLAAMLLGSAGAFADSAVTKPAGFVTHTLKAGQYNLIGLTLHQPVLVTGELDDVTGTVIGDNEVNFSSTLTAGKTYILEITDAADPELNGTIQEVTVWNGNEMTTPQDLGADGLLSGDKYQIRPAVTLRQIFGINNEAGLQEGPSGVADLVWVATGPASFTKYYYHPGSTFPVNEAEGWKVLGGGDAPAVPIALTDSVVVERRGGTDLKVILTGSVKTQVISIAVPGKYTYISSVFPVGSTLANSGLVNSMQHGVTGTADLLWIPTADAKSYDKYYYHPGSTFPVNVTAGWKVLGDDTTDQSGVALKSGMIIERRASSPYNAKITPPPSYSNL